MLTNTQVVKVTHIALAGDVEHEKIHLAIVIMTVETASSQGRC